MKRPIPVQFTLQDVKTLIHCKAQLDAVINALAASNWTGAKPTIAALGLVDRYICDLYNRCEPYWLRYLEREPGSKGHASLKESLATQAGVVLPPGSSNQGEG